MTKILGQIMIQFEVSSRFDGFWSTQSNFAFGHAAASIRQDWGPECAENETPQASVCLVGWGMRRRYPFPSRLGALGSVVSPPPPSSVRGGSPAEKKFGAFLASQNTSGGTIAYSEQATEIVAFYVFSLIRFSEKELAWDIQPGYWLGCTAGHVQILGGPGLAAPGLTPMLWSSYNGTWE